MASAAPRVTTDKGADVSLSIAAWSADVNLTAQVGKPPHAAQIVEFFNAHETEAQAAVWVDENGTSNTVQVPPAGGCYATRIPVKTLVDSGTGANISAIAYWWMSGGYQVNR